MKKFLLVLCVFFLLGEAYSQNVLVTTRLQNKMQVVNPLQYTRVMILMKNRVNMEQMDADLYRMNASLEYRYRTVITALMDNARATQGPLLDYLGTQKNVGKVAEFHGYWIINLVYMKATTDVINQLMLRNDIEMMDLDDELQMDKPLNPSPEYSRNTEAVQIGLRVIKADSVWARGFTGQGATVMNIDNGVNGTHAALNSRWWGNNGRPWYHAWYNVQVPTVNFPAPCGTDFHGSHTMGIMTGRTDAGDTIGVAPNARWMAAAVTDCPGAVYPTNNITAFQWGVNPDSNVNTMDYPIAISCSWQDPNAGDQCATSIYRTLLVNLEAVGTGIVFSAGNSGPNASTITPPKNINLDSINVMCTGAVDGNTAGYPIASFSSRGPSVCGGVGTLGIKPEISAPGVNISSCGSGNSYYTISGTSMASPHVGGAIALLKSVAPQMTGKQIKAVIFSTCDDLGTAGEDNTYGKGLINLNRAFSRLAAYPLNPYNLQTPSAGARIVTFPGSTTPVTITWDTSATGANYKFIFGNPTTSTRRITIPSSSNVYTTTLGELDNILSGAGFTNNGTASDSAVGQWDVWAFKAPLATGPDSLKSTNGPRAITFRRGVPALTPFSLVTPPNGTTITTSVFNNNPVNINWTRSGVGIKYKWLFDAPTFAGAPVLYVQSGNSGFDSSLTLINSQLDAMLAAANVNPGDSLVGQYRVYAYRSATDSLASTQTFALTLKRQAKGDVLVAYDSTSAGCRTAKDSVSNNLNALNVSFDLYNRTGNTTTTSLSFRGYKKVMWLGEGTSVISPVQRDSLKSYLNSGGTTVATKSKLIFFAEDVGYQLYRTGGAAIDTSFCRSMLGWDWLADRLRGTAAHGLKGVGLNTDIMDSTVGTFPDVLKKSYASSVKTLYTFRLSSSPDSVNAIGRHATNFNVATFGVDVESMRPSSTSPAGSPVRRFVTAALGYVDQLLVSTEPNTLLIPDRFELSQNYPNPFNPSTKINFSVPKQSFVTLRIFDVTGREVAKLVNNMMTPGYHSIDFNASSFASGVYFYRMEAGDFVDTRRMMLIK